MASLIVFIIIIVYYNLYSTYVRICLKFSWNNLIMNDYKPQSDFLRCLQDRGFFHQCTDVAALDQRLKEGPIVAYIGFDATSDCLHVGSLVQIMMLRWLQRFGHKPIVLMGAEQPKLVTPRVRIRSVSY